MNLAQRVMMLRNWFTNLITNGNFSNGITGWTSYYCVATTEAPDKCKMAGNGAGAYPCINIVGNYPNSTDLVYYACEMMVTNSDALTIAIRSNSAETSAIVNNPVANKWYKLSCVQAAGNSSANFSPSHRYSTASNANGKIGYVKNCIAINLTAIYGLSKEPTKEWCDINISPFVKY